ncbi:ABC transporter substrate-binding protein [Falsiroseomonas sp.]|uniref:ABC transporter substrate-binding protein n=1 Tax=Falsiroseomonas sp. TaxID=2870721 RepID=UPI003F72CB2F
MQITRATLLRGAAAALAGLAAPRIATAQPLERLPLTLNWKLQGLHGAFFLAVDRGFFRAEGLNPDIVAGDGSANVVNRLAGGAWQIGLGDIASLVRFNMQNPEKRVKAIYNQTPADLAVVALRGRGITRPEDLRGKLIGAPVGDTAYKMFPAFSAATGVPASALRWEHMAPNIREAMLMQGRVDAITANEGTALFNLKAAGVKVEDMVFLRYGDFGVNIVNIGMMANESFLREKPETVRRVIRAVHRGYAAAIAEPAAALDSLMRRDPLLNRAIEAERLMYSIERMVDQPDVREGGLGFYAEASVQRSIGVIAAAESLTATLAAGDMMDNAYLPPASERRLPAVGRV